MFRKVVRAAFCAALLSWAAFADAALAQDQGEFAELPKEKPYLAWTIGVAFLALTLIVAFKHPHRGHQD